MKAHLILPLSLLIMVLAIAVSTGSPVFLLLTLLIAMILLSGLASVLWAAGTLSVSAEISEQTVRRGEDATLVLRIRHRCLIPIAPVLLELGAVAGTREREIRLRDLPGRTQTLRMPLYAAHVGIFGSGVRSCTVEDLLGIFQRKIVFPDSLFELVVLPRPFETEPLTLSPGDPGSEIVSRATEDLNAPSDTRDYQPGDAMKKIHWKLSLRKGELIVRKFDEPILRDVLLLMDCSPPPSWGRPEAEADLRDAMLETAASVFQREARTDHTLRLPLYGDHPVDVESSMGLPIVFDYLARVTFTETDRFERMLTLESRRLRKTGCVVVISARLNYAMVDVMTRMRRMGPTMRFYLITPVPDDPQILPLVSRLRQGGIQVSYVTPDAD